MVDMILDKAGQKGTGKWSAIEAQNMGVPATAIEAAVAARSLSSLKTEREAAEKIFGMPEYKFPIAYGPELNKDLELALFAAKIGAYAQGFAVMAEASREFNWSLPMPTIAKIWRAGCIIRSQFLDEITSAFTKAPDAANLIVTPAFSEMVKESLPCAAPRRCRRTAGRPAGSGAHLGADLFRRLSPGPRHGQPDPGAARLLRRPRLRPPRRQGLPPRPVGQWCGDVLSLLKDQPGLPGWPGVPRIGTPGMPCQKRISAIGRTRMRALPASKSSSVSLWCATISAKVSVSGIGRRMAIPNQCNVIAQRHRTPDLSCRRRTASCSRQRSDA